MSLILLLGYTIALPGFAHEPRDNVSGAFTLIVGNRIEPTYVGQPAKFNLFIRDLAGNPTTSVNVNNHTGTVFTYRRF